MRGFGTFRAKMTRAVKGRNPKTGETIEIPERIKVVFKPSKVAK
jgi:nucleoid DNA-binding protein